MGGRDHLFKVLVVGDAAVGKTSLVQRYSQDSFSKHYKSTVGGETAPRGRGAPPRVGSRGLRGLRPLPGQEVGVQDLGGTNRPVFDLHVSLGFLQFGSPA